MADPADADAPFDRADDWESSVNDYDLVVVAASGRLIAYDSASGEERWRGPSGEESYSSPQLMTLNGVPQVVQLDGVGVIGVAPADGALLCRENPKESYEPDGYNGFDTEAALREYIQSISVPKDE